MPTCCSPPPFSIFISSVVCGDGRKALSCGEREFSFIHFKLGVHKSAGLIHELTLRACYLKSVCSGEFTCRCDEHACRTVRVLCHSGNIVFYLDVVILAVFAVRVDRGRHTEYPLPQVKVVRALIEKNTAAFACPCSSPSAAVVVRLSSVPVGYDPYASLQLSERTVLYHFAHLLVELVCALVVHDTERPCRSSLQLP